MKKICLFIAAAAGVLGTVNALEEGNPSATAGYHAYSPKDFSHLKGMKGFSDALLTMHFKLYEGYVKNSNLLYSQIQDLLKNGKDRSPEYAGLKRMYGWEFDGMRLHEYYFGNLGGDGKPNPSSPLYQKIVKQFGSYDNWKKDFISTGMMRGIGWAILYEDPASGNLVNTWINEHDLGHLAGGKPLVVMDVFEHAYITEYGLNREQYIQAFFDNLSWGIAEERYGPSQLVKTSSDVSSYDYSFPWITR